MFLIPHAIRAGTTSLGGGASPSPLIHQSLFDGAADTLLTAYTPDVGASWTEQAGVVKLDGTGGATFTSGTVPVYTFDSGEADGYWSAEQSSTNHFWGIVLRWTTPDVFFLGWLTANQLILYESPSFAVRASSAASVTPGAGKIMKMEASGTNIKMKYDELNEISYASATTNQTVTVHGIYCSTGFGSRWADYNQYTLAGTLY